MRRIPHTMTQLFWTTSEVWATVDRAWGGLERGQKQQIPVWVSHWSTAQFLWGQKGKPRGAVSRQENVWCCRHTFEPGIPVHPVPNDGPQQQHGARHHQPVHGRQQQAVPVQLHQENGHGKVPHSVTLRTRISGQADEKFLPSQPDLEPWGKAADSKLVCAQTCRGTLVFNSNNKCNNSNDTNVIISNLVVELELGTMWLCTKMMMMVMMMINNGRASLTHVDSACPK